MIRFPDVSAPEVSVLLPAYRGVERLLRALGRMSALVPESPSFEVVLVLNGASPQVVEAVETEVRGARLVRAAVNRGFAGGLVLASREARGAFLLLAQDDTVPEVGWMTELRATFDACPGTGAVGSVVRACEGRLLSPGNVVWRDGSTAPAFDPAAPPEGFEGAAPVDYCSSSSLMIPTAVWEAVGGVDQGLFPAYYVDTDLGTAVWASGRAVRCCSGSVVRHEEAASSARPYREFLIEDHRTVFARRWSPMLARYSERSGDPAADLERAREATARRLEGLGSEPPVVPIEDDPRLGTGAWLSDADCEELERVTRSRYLAWIETRLEATRRALDEASDYARRLEREIAAKDENEARAREHLRGLEARLREGAGG